VTARGAGPLEIEIVRLEGKWKLSQNRPAGDIDGVVDGLRASEDASSLAVADIMADRHRHR